MQLKIYDLTAILIALIHIYVFFLESVLWGRPKTNRQFGVNAEEAKINSLMAFNQGFYNLFLSIAVFAGLALMNSGNPEGGRALVDYATLSVFGAGAVLILSARRLWRAALAQSLPALIYWVLRLMWG